MLDDRDDYRLFHPGFLVVGCRSYDQAARKSTESISAMAPALLAPRNVQPRRSRREIEYGPVKEPWGVIRFFARDPFGRLVNIMTHG